MILLYFCLHFSSAIRFHTLWCSSVCTLFFVPPSRFLLSHILTRTLQCGYYYTVRSCYNEKSIIYLPLILKFDNSHHRTLQESQVNTSPEGGGDHLTSPHFTWPPIGCLVLTGLLHETSTSGEDIWGEKFHKQAGATRVRGQELNFECGESVQAAMYVSAGMSRNRTNQGLWGTTSQNLNM